MKVFPYFEESEITSLDADFILTAVPLKHSLPIATTEISIFINNEDESNIFQLINKIHKSKFQLEFNAKISQLIDPQFFYSDLALSSPDEVIKHMCKELENNNIIGEDFCESVLKRETMSPTSFAYSLAVPHSLDLVSNRPIISIAILKNSIKWGEYNVKIIFLLATNNSDNEMLRMFFDWMATTSINTEKITRLLKIKDYESFINEMMD